MQLTKYLTLTAAAAAMYAAGALTVSAAEVGPLFNPSTPQEWDMLTQANYAAAAPQAAQLAEQYGLQVKSLDIAGVPCYLFTPKDAKEGRLLFYVHGGGYVLGSGMAGANEGMIMAGRTGYQVLAVDYRMPPAEAPFPAAVDDMMAVYEAVIKDHASQSIGVFGSSTGGALTLILSQECTRLHLPQPGALIAGTPWADIDRIGDTYISNDGQDEVLISYDGWIKPAARLYANGEDFKNPRISPVYGDFSHYPPVMLVSGTRDLFLSNTVRVQEKLLKAGIETDLLVLEGASHCSYYLFNDSDWADFYHQQAEKFWQSHLAEDASQAQ